MQRYTGRWVYFHLMDFLNDTTTPRTTDGNIFEDSEVQQQSSELSDLEEVNSFMSDLNDIEDVQSSENSISVSQSVTIPCIPNLVHSNSSTNISNNSDTFVKKITSKKKKRIQENQNFENKLLKLETQKINAFLECNKTNVKDDEDMMF